MQELVNHDDLRRQAISQRSFRELSSTDVNSPRAWFCEGQRRTACTLRRIVTVDEPQRSERFGGTPAAGDKRCPEGTTRLVRKVREHFLTARAREAGGGPFNSTLHGEPTVAVDESEKHLGCCLCAIRSECCP